jgi:hypothetical protein
VIDSAALHYTVRRMNWRKVVDCWVRLPGTTRLTCHADPDSAEHQRSRLEAEARSAINPFLCGRTLCERTSLDAGRLNDWVLDLGLTPPRATKTKPPNWANWWKRRKSKMTEYQREKMWEALDRLRFYDVVAGPVRPVVYVVLEIRWYNYGSEYTSDMEGGEPHKVFRTREEAEAYCRDSFRTFSGSDPVYLDARLHCLNDPLRLRPHRWKGDCRGDKVPRYDIIEVEVEQLASKRSETRGRTPLYLV